MKWFRHFLDIIYPRSCEACGNALFGGENLICIDCMIDLPRTNSHIERLDQVSNRFWGKVPVSDTITFMRFSKKDKWWLLLKNYIGGF